MATKKVKEVESVPVKIENKQDEPALSNQKISVKEACNEFQLNNYARSVALRVFANGMYFKKEWEKLFKNSKLIE